MSLKSIHHSHVTTYQTAIQHLEVAGNRSIAGHELEELEHLRTARAILDNLITGAAREAYADGESWTAIGRALGVSKQSAWEKFGTPAAATTVRVHCLSCDTWTVPMTHQQATAWDKKHAASKRFAGHATEIVSER